jgi:hypothetical protein
MSTVPNGRGLDPARIVADVFQTAKAAGLNPTLKDTPGSAGAAITAACNLLRAIGVTPVDANGRAEVHR